MERLNTNDGDSLGLGQVASIARVGQPDRQALLYLHGYSVSVCVFNMFPWISNLLCTCV